MTNLIQIGKHRLESNVLVAPMSGLSDLPFRRVMQKFKPGLVVSEMVASEGLTKGHGDGQTRAAGKDEIKPLVIQLIGREAYWMEQGARLAEEAGADIVDINMGCPARKVTSGLSGSALMRDLDHAIEADLAKRAQDEGICMVTVHGRTRCQFYEGSADWEAVAEVVQAVDIPVIVNGDIHSPSDALLALEQSGAAGVMVGRGLIGRPWHIGNLMAAVDSYEAPMPLSLERRCQVSKQHYIDMLDFYGEARGIRKARKHLRGYVEHAPGLDDIEREALTSTLMKTTQPQTVLQALDVCFDKAKLEKAA